MADLPYERVYLGTFTAEPLTDEEKANLDAGKTVYLRFSEDCWTPPTQEEEESRAGQ